MKLPLINKKILKIAAMVFAVVLIVGVVGIPGITSAAGFLDGPAESVINGTLARIANFFLWIASSLVFISGIFLSMSINLTTHLGEFFNNIPALREVWLVIRNIASIFIIFSLLYASISTILGTSSSHVKDLIGNIIFAGLLINFSLFFVRVAVDASNLASLQFYRAIAPNSSESFNTGKVFTDGGLSNVFMSSLKIPTIYQNKDLAKSTDIFASISLASIAGILMMVMAALSFTGAAIMFTARTAILIFVMTLSPLYFAAMIFPEAKKHADDLFKLFKSQLIFMPTYLFLMYVALRIISSPGFSTIFNQSATGTNPSTGIANITLAGVMIQFIIAFIFINAPLVAAIAAGGVGAKWAEGLSSGIEGWIKKQPGNIGSGAWRNTGSRVASRLAQSDGFQKLAGKSLIGEQLLKGTRGVAGSYNERLDKQVKSREETFKSFSNKEAKSEYASRLSNTLSTKSGRLSMGATGRADRVAAAKLLITREKEIKEEINKLQKRKDELERARDGTNSKAGRTLIATELEELDDIGDAISGTGDLGKEKNNLESIRSQIVQFQVNTGGQYVAGPLPAGSTTPLVTGGVEAKIVSKRGY